MYDSIEVRYACVWRKGDPRLFRFTCLALPYGRWTTADGREVLFNRGYEPLWERSPNFSARAANPQEWVEPIKKQEFFYNDGSHPMYRHRVFVTCLRVLDEFGIQPAEFSSSQDYIGEDEEVMEILRLQHHHRLQP